MSTFRNNGPAGVKFFPDAFGADTQFLLDEVVTASNYFKRYVTAGELELVSDDGGVWDDEAAAPAAVVRETTLSIPSGDTWDDNELSCEDLIGGPAYDISIDTDRDTRVRINGDSDSTFLVEANTVKHLTKDDGILATSLTFDRTQSGATGTAVVRITLIGRSS